MPVRRAESLTTLRVQCRAPNSLADSRHQACLVSDSCATARIARSLNRRRHELSRCIILGSDRFGGATFVS